MPREPILLTLAHALAVPDERAPNLRTCAAVILGSLALASPAVPQLILATARPSMPLFDGCFVCWPAYLALWPFL